MSGRGPLARHRGRTPPPRPPAPARGRCRRASRGRPDVSGNAPPRRAPQRSGARRPRTRPRRAGRRGERGVGAPGAALHVLEPDRAVRLGVSTRASHQKSGWNTWPRRGCRGSPRPRVMVQGPGRSISQVDAVLDRPARYAPDEQLPVRQAERALDVDQQQADAPLRRARRERSACAPRTRRPPARRAIRDAEQLAHPRGIEVRRNRPRGPAPISSVAAVRAVGGDQRVDHEPRGQLRGGRRCSWPASTGAPRPRPRSGAPAWPHQGRCTTARAAAAACGLAQRVHVATASSVNAEQPGEHDLVEEVACRARAGWAAPRPAAGSVRAPAAPPPRAPRRPARPARTRAPRRSGPPRRGATPARRREPEARSRAPRAPCSRSGPARAPGGTAAPAGRPAHRREVAEGPRAVGARLVAVAERRGVAVVAVGDVGPASRGEQPARSPRAAPASVTGNSRCPTPPSSRKAAIGEAARGGPGQRREAPRSVVEHQEDRAEVRARGAAAGASGPPSGPFACARAAGRASRRPPPENAPAGRRGTAPVEREVLLDQVERGRVVRDERPVRTTRGTRPRLA